MKTIVLILCVLLCGCATSRVTVAGGTVNGEFISMTMPDKTEDVFHCLNGAKPMLEEREDKFVIVCEVKK